MSQKLDTAFIKRLLWSVANFGSSFGLRFAQNVVLTRLLDPSVFGIMVIVSAMRLGMELLTDVGIEQNIVRHANGATPDFLNTAWTLQIIRGFFLLLAFLVLSPVLAHFYDIDIRVFAVIAFAPFLTSLHSTSIFLAVKRLEVKRRTIFEFCSEACGFAIIVTLVLIQPSVWSLLFGTLGAIAVRSAFSYRLEHPRHKLMLDRDITKEILTFGRWIFISSLVMFAASNLDRLTLGKVAPLALLGIYGLARTLGDIPVQLARRISYQVVFPMMADAKGRGGSLDTAKLGFARRRLLLVGAVGFGVAIAGADIAVGLIYDDRYRDAGWMLAMLLVGSWLSILSNLNESLLLGLGKPVYETMGNLLRFCLLAAGIWLGFSWFGIAGAIMATIVGELGRYCVVSVGQRRVGVTFWRQDVVATALMLGGAALWIFLRAMAGFPVFAPPLPLLGG